MKLMKMLTPAEHAEFMRGSEQRFREYRAAVERNKRMLGLGAAVSHQTDIDAVRAMGREELESRLLALLGEIRQRMYASDLRHHLLDVPQPPFQVPELYETEGDCE